MSFTYCQKFNIPQFNRIDFKNALAQGRRATGAGTPTEARDLIQWLAILQQMGQVRFTAVVNPVTQALQRVFVVFTASSILFRAYPEVVVFDSTHKTNRFGMPLFLLLGIASDNTTFITGAALLDVENASVVDWLFGLLQDYFGRDVLAKTQVYICDGDPSFNGVGRFFPNALWFLCQWHVVKNARPKIQALASALFQVIWPLLQEAVYAPDEATCRTTWTKILGLAAGAPNLLTYLSNMHSRIERFCRSFTDRKLNLGSHTSGRAEADNRVIKAVIGKRTISLMSLFEQIRRMVDHRISEMAHRLSNQQTRVKSLPATDTDRLTIESTLTAHTAKIQLEQYDQLTQYAVHMHKQEPGIATFHVVRIDKPSRTRPSHQHTVVIRAAAILTVECSCNFYTQWCLQCRHELAVRLAVRSQIPHLSVIDVSKWHSRHTVQHLTALIAQLAGVSRATDIAPASGSGHIDPALEGSIVFGTQLTGTDSLGDVMATLGSAGAAAAAAPTFFALSTRGSSDLPNFIQSALTPHVTGAAFHARWQARERGFSSLADSSARYSHLMSTFRGIADHIAHHSKESGHGADLMELLEAFAEFTGAKSTGYIGVQFFGEQTQRAPNTTSTLALAAPQSGSGESCVSEIANPAGGATRKWAKGHPRPLQVQQICNHCRQFGHTISHCPATRGVRAQPSVATASATSAPSALTVQGAAPSISLGVLPGAGRGTAAASIPVAPVSLANLAPVSTAVVPAAAVPATAAAAAAAAAPGVGRGGGRVGRGGRGGGRGGRGGKSWRRPEVATLFFARALCLRGQPCDLPLDHLGRCHDNSIVCPCLWCAGETEFDSIAPPRHSTTSLFDRESGGHELIVFLILFTCLFI